MVFALVVLTVVIFLGVDFLLRKEDRAFKESDKTKKSPIFLSPEKSLHPLPKTQERMYHLSHSWALSYDDDYVYVGFDDFISTLFASEVKVADLPAIGMQVPQGTKIWDVHHDGHKISQLSPISGRVVDINPACKVEIPLPSKDLEQSWIMKMKPNNLKSESNNLMKHTQAKVLNSALKDDLYIYAQQGYYLNDGGTIDPNYIWQMSDDEWNELVRKFFPYHDNL